MPEHDWPEGDQHQRDIRKRNNALAALLSGAYNNNNIVSITRQPRPTNPPGPDPPDAQPGHPGTWLITVDDP